MDLHGFRVVPFGPISTGFTRALRRLEERGYVDARCTIVKTANGPSSGITHAGGRYVHADNPSAPDVLAEMRRQCLDPPPMPFVVAPGATTLFHEWGHHVDRLWSGADGDVLFSFRWFSQFYEIRIRRIDIPDDRRRDEMEDGRIETPLDAADAAPVWHSRTSELFATLFEEWMGATAKPYLNWCEPADLNDIAASNQTRVRLRLRPGVSATQVRARTYEQFARGQDRHVKVPSVREDLFGDHTTATIDAFRTAMRELRGEARTTSLKVGWNE